MPPPTDAHISQLDAGQARAAAAGLVELLIDAVAGGASVGFPHPLDREQALQYWQAVAADVEASRAVLLVAGEPPLGTVQLRFSTYPNGRHRAEIAKLLVHRSGRRQGLGRKLMAAVEESARGARKTLLFLDTETGSPAEQLYTLLGWRLAGVIPDFAYNPGGELRPSSFFYKLLR